MRTSRYAGIFLSGLAITAGTAVYFASQSNAAPANPVDQLQCLGQEFVVTEVYQDYWTKETASPEQQADLWAVAKKESGSPAELTGTTTYMSASQANVAFRDGTSTVAVLMYEDQGELGWRLDSIVECG